MKEYNLLILGTWYLMNQHLVQNLVQNVFQDLCKIVTGVALLPSSPPSPVVVNILQSTFGNPMRKFLQ